MIGLIYVDRDGTEAVVISNKGLICIKYLPDGCISYIGKDRFKKRFTVKIEKENLC